MSALDAAIEDLFFKLGAVTRQYFLSYIQLESTQILDACPAGRACEEVSKFADGTDI